jgi:hypothetical protein
MTTEQAADAGATLVSKLAGTAQVAGVGLAVGSATKQYFGFTLDEWSLIGILFGIVLGLVGFVVGQAVNIYFKAQHLKLAREKASEFYQ